MSNIAEYKSFSVSNKQFTPSIIQFRLQHIAFERSTTIQIFNPKLKIWQFFTNVPRTITIDQAIDTVKRMKPSYFTHYCMN